METEMLNQLLIQEPYTNKKMDEYKILNQKVFESSKSFERRLNEICQHGWKPISITSDHGSKSILLQKIDKHENY